MGSHSARTLPEINRDRLAVAAQTDPFAAHLRDTGRLPRTASDLAIEAQRFTSGLTPLEVAKWSPVVFSKSAGRYHHGHEPLLRELFGELNDDQVAHLDELTHMAAEAGRAEALLSKHLDEVAGTHPTALVRLSVRNDFGQRIDAIRRALTRERHEPLAEQTRKAWEADAARLTAIHDAFQRSDGMTLRQFADVVYQAQADHGALPRGDDLWYAVEPPFSPFDGETSAAIVANYTSDRITAEEHAAELAMVIDGTGLSQPAGLTAG